LKNICENKIATECPDGGEGAVATRDRAAYGYKSITIAWQPYTTCYRMCLAQVLPAEDRPASGKAPMQPAEEAGTVPQVAYRLRDNVDGAYGWLSVQ